MGSGCWNRRQRSLKWDCAEERSDSVTGFHLRTNACAERVSSSSPPLLRRGGEERHRDGADGEEFGEIDLEEIRRQGLRFEVVEAPVEPVRQDAEAQPAVGAEIGAGEVILKLRRGRRLAPRRPVEGTLPGLALDEDRRVPVALGGERLVSSLPPRLGRQEEDRIGDAQAADVVELLLDEAPVVQPQGIKDREEDEAFGVPFLQALRAVRQPRPERFGDRVDLAFAEVQPVPNSSRFRSAGNPARTVSRRPSPNPALRPVPGRCHLKMQRYMILLDIATPVAGPLRVCPRAQRCAFDGGNGPGRESRAGMKGRTLGSDPSGTTVSGGSKPPQALSRGSCEPSCTGRGDQRDHSRWSRWSRGRRRHLGDTPNSSH